MFNYTGSPTHLALLQQDSVSTQNPTLGQQPMSGFSNMNSNPDHISFKRNSLIQAQKYREKLKYVYYRLEKYSQNVDLFNLNQQLYSVYYQLYILSQSNPNKEPGVSIKEIEPITVLKHVNQQCLEGFVNIQLINPGLLQDSKQTSEKNFIKTEKESFESLFYNIF